MEKILQLPYWRMPFFSRSAPAIGYFEVFFRAGLGTEFSKSLAESDRDGVPVCCKSKPIQTCCHWLGDFFYEPLSLKNRLLVSGLDLG